MKKLGLLLMLLFCFVSCSSDDNEDTSFKGKWELTSVVTNFDPAANTIDDLPQWKETYVFSNGKFSKTRIKDGKTTIVTGTYKMTESETEIKLELAFKESDDIIMSCIDLKENLSISSEILYNTLRTCDGSVYKYTKIK